MILSNNRFLQRVNPAIDRALADSGSSLDHPEIQRLARQMVDLGIWGNLVFWAHEGLVKERVSGSDVFVPKAYDITANNNDAVQSNSTRQPRLINSELVFNGSSTNFLLSNTSANTPYCTVCAWFKINSSTGQNQIIFNKQNNIQGTINVAYNNNSQGLVFFIALSDSPTTNRFCNAPSNTTNTGTYYFVCATYNGSQMILYQNLTVLRTTNISGTINTSNYANTVIGSSLSNSAFFNGIISDLRYFDTALTATQLDEIFQETKAKYGY